MKLCTKLGYVLAGKRSFVARKTYCGLGGQKCSSSCFRKRQAGDPKGPRSPVWDMVVSTLRSVMLVLRTTYKQRGNKVGLAEGSPSEHRIRLLGPFQSAKLHSAFGV